MTMAKGKEKPQEGRVTRSKSPARGQTSVTKDSPPPTSTPRRQRSRSRSRSKSPARTPAKAGTLKAEPAVRVSRKSEPLPAVKSEAESAKAKQAESTVVSPTTIRTSRRSEVVEEKVLRSSSRIAALATSPSVTQRKTETVSLQKVEEVKPSETKQHDTKSQPLSSSLAPFLHQFASFLVFVTLISLVWVASLMCSLEKCDVSKLPLLPTSIASYVDKQAVLIFVTWVVLQLILASVPLGWRRTGGVLPDGTRLQFRCNGLIALSLVLLVLGGLHYLKVPVFSTVKKQFLPLLFTSSGFTLIASFLFHVRAKRLPANKLSHSSRTGLVAFMLGREAHPRVGSLNVKIFNVIHISFLSWAAMICIMAINVYQTSPGNTSFIIVAALQFFYIVDFVLFEASLSNSLMIAQDCVGFISIFMTFVWMPFFHTVLLRYTMLHPQTVTYPLLGASVALFVLGYLVARVSNYVKDKFRQQQLNVTAHKLIPTTSGKPLLASGLWSLCRHPNYLGCWLMAIAWSLPCGLTSPITYIYASYMLILFALRAWRDGVVCQQKHGSAAWTQYCQRVRSRIIPFVY